MKILQRT